jgi:hypothetical protein
MTFSTVQYIRMFQGSLPTTNTTQYTTPASRQDVIKCIDIANGTGAAITCTVYLVPTGNTAGAANVILPAVIIPGDQVLHWTGTQVMNAGDFLSTTTSATGLCMTVSGLESQ